MEDYSENQAYKHLLSVAQNIIDSLQTDPNIINKYHSLKSALLAKVTHDPLQQQLTYTRKLLNTYKYISSSVLQVISQFESQIQSSFQRQHYNRKVIAVVKEWELRLDEARSAVEVLAQKPKLIAKEEMSALSYYCGELDGKLQNLGLLIQVHKKMHEIIEQAARSQSQKARRQQALQSNVQELQRQLGNVREARAFAEQHRLTQKQYKEYKVWSNKLSSLLMN